MNTKRPEIPAFFGLGAAVTAIVIPAVVVTTGGRKLTGGEGNPGEHFAGIFRQTWIITNGCRGRLKIRPPAHSAVLSTGPISAI